MATIVAANSTSGPAPFNPGALIYLVETWEGLMKERRSITLRAKAAERGGANVPLALVETIATLEKQENRLKRQIVKEYDGHPLAEWGRSIHGLGDHSFAYLLACLNGDPLTAYPKRWVEGKQHKRVIVEDEPYTRSISQLWSYCGYGNPENRRRKGMTQEAAFALGNPRLKSRLRLIAESFLKSGNEEYRAIYDAARKEYESREWTDGHRHSAALRRVVKEFLRNLWLEASARAIAESTPKRSTPARARRRSIPILEAPARAEVLA